MNITIIRIHILLGRLKQVYRVYVGLKENKQREKRDKEFSGETGLHLK